MNEAYNIDCMEFMRRVPSKYFDLAVVDPPYGIEKGFKATSRVRRYGQTKTANDDKPTAEYFTELFRVSRNQIIWGYNQQNIFRSKNSVLKNIQRSSGYSYDRRKEGTSW